MLFKQKLVSHLAAVSYLITLLSSGLVLIGENIGNNFIKHDSRLIWLRFAIKLAPNGGTIPFQGWPNSFVYLSPLPN